METIKKIFYGTVAFFEKEISLYKFIAWVGFIIRVGLLPLFIPNVFKVIADIMISSWGLPQWTYEILIRVFIAIIDGIGLSNIFYHLSFISTGNSYETCTIPAWGSVCYTLYYVIYNVMAIVILQFFEIWVIAVTFSVYAVLSAGIYLLSAFLFETLPDKWVLRLIFHIFITIVFLVGIILLRVYAF